MLQIVLVLAGVAGAGALKDLPVVGTTGVLSLNGVDWTASGKTREVSGECSYEKGVDYGAPKSGVPATPVAYHGSLEQCCQLCGASATCAASVWDGSHCVFKTAADLAHRATNQTGKTACRIGAVTSRAISIAASVPGDLVTDLQRAGVVGDPLRDVNFQDNASAWSGPRWTYTKTFRVPDDGSFFARRGRESEGADEEAGGATAVLLVFDGIKMGATVALDGRELGNATNQHRRWVFPVADSAVELRARAQGADGAHTLTVTFDAEIGTEGRYMDCSGGWDWAPYSYMRDPDGNPAFTKGIWKGVYLVGFDRAAAAITYFVPQVRYAGDHYPTARLDDGTAAFAVDARVFLHAAADGVRGTVVVEGEWGAAQRKDVTLQAGENVVLLTLAADAPRLWWPKGMGGAPTLYNVSARFEPAAVDRAAKGAAAADAPRAVRRVGFRHVVLVTSNDTNSTWVAEAEAQHMEGNGHHTLMFRVNGAPFFAKGANMIPMETLEGRYVDGMHAQLVRSAADGGMNLLRVWGGGIYPVDEWLDACDEVGVLVFTDMMYGTDGIMPGATATPNQEAELRHQVRRLGHHASVIAYSGCNECGGMGVWTDFVITTVAQEDRTRPVRSSCPWVGYESGVDALTGFPTGGKLVPVQPPAPPPPPPTPAPSKTCVFTKGVDYHPDSVMATVKTDDAAACCADCAARADCRVGVLYDGQCYLKAAHDSVTAYNRSGRIACQPKKAAAAAAEAAAAAAAAEGEKGRVEITAHGSVGVVGSSPFPGGDDIHGPYQHGGIFPARNGGGQMFQPPVVVDVQPGFAVGASQPGYFRTETGCSVLSSFESMSGTLSPANWGIHTPPFHERNYPCDPIILSYFNSSRTPIDLDRVGEGPLKKQTYLCMLGQAIQRKTDIESWRSGNVWGTLLWQLNEIWPTGGWGSLEYGTPGHSAGQVIGGRWKPLHHFMRQSAYADVTAACGNAKLQLTDAGPTAAGTTMCYVKNDSPVPFEGSVAIELVHFATAAVSRVGNVSVELGPGAGAAAFFCPNGGARGAAADTGAAAAPAGTAAADAVLAGSCPTFEALFAAAGCHAGGADCIMRVRVTTPQPTPSLLLADNLLPLAVPSSFNLPAANVTAEVLVDAAATGGTSIQLHSDSAGIALYVWLSTLASGRFSDNGFLMVPGTTTVDFLPFGGLPVNRDLLRSSLRVEHLGGHLASLH